MQCPSCRTENTEGAKLCSACGAPLLRLCPSCGQQMQPTAKFCSECGTPLVAVAPRLTVKKRKDPAPARVRKAARRTASTTAAQPRPTVPEAERRQLTVM